MQFNEICSNTLIKYVRKYNLFGFFTLYQHISPYYNYKETPVHKINLKIILPFNDV